MKKFTQPAKSFLVLFSGILILGLTSCEKETIEPNTASTERKAVSTSQETKYATDHITPSDPLTPVYHPKTKQASTR
jgi:hypothetical protein